MSTVKPDFEIDLTIDSESNRKLLVEFLTNCSKESKSEEESKDFAQLAKLLKEDDLAWTEDREELTMALFDRRMKIVDKNLN